MLFDEFGRSVFGGEQIQEETRWQLADLERKIKRNMKFGSAISALSLVAGSIYTVFVGGDIGYFVIGIGTAGAIIIGIMKWG